MSELPFTWDQVGNLLMQGLVLLLFTCTSIFSIGKAMETVSRWRRPKKALAEQVEAHEKRLCDGNQRFERQDSMIGDLQAGQRVLCVGMQALLESAVYGNNSGGVKDAHTKLKEYLADGVGGKK
jgi:hypothetical protein